MRRSTSIFRRRAIHRAAGRSGGFALIAVLLFLSGCGLASATPLPPPPNHVVVVVEENHSYSDIIGNGDAPYFNEIAAKGALFADAYGVEHPSQPNYLDLFSGGNHGITNDSCPHTLDGPNLARSLINAGKTFVGYSEDLPYAGYTGCASGTYRRKHNPWVDFKNLPGSVNLPMSAFPIRYAELPTVSFVIPGLKTDMHSGSVRAADSWLKSHLSGYLRWAMSHNSLLIITWDESEDFAGNRIPLIIVGAHVKPGTYHQHITHFSLLRTIEDMFALKAIGKSAHARPIVGVWK